MLSGQKNCEVGSVQMSERLGLSAEKEGPSVNAGATTQEVAPALDDKPRRPTGKRSMTRPPASPTKADAPATPNRRRVVRRLINCFDISFFILSSIRF